MKVRIIATIVCVCACGSKGGPTPDRTKRVSESEAAAVDSVRVAAEPPIPDGWVAAEGEGWSGAFPVTPTFKPLEPGPPEGTALLGTALIKAGEGAFLTLMRWPTARQEANPRQFEANLAQGFADQIITMGSKPSAQGTMKAGGQTCSTRRFVGGHPAGTNADFLFVTCFGSGVAIGWLGEESRLDEILAHFKFDPSRVARAEAK